MIEEMYQITELFSAVGARVGYYDITKTFLDLGNCLCDLFRFFYKLKLKAVYVCHKQGFLISF